MKPSPFQYSLLQYRHDVWTGEVLNVGLLMLCEEKNYLRLKTRSGKGRVGAAFPDLDYGSLRYALQNLEKALSASPDPYDLSILLGPTDIMEWATKALPFDDSSLCFARPGSGLTVDPVSRHEELFERLVSRYDNFATRDSRPDEAVFDAVRVELKKAHLYDKIEDHTVRSDFATHTFKHSFKNGVWHCMQPISFDSADEEHMQVKAQKWAGVLQSLKGEMFRPYLITGAPKKEHLMKQYDKMRRFLETSAMDPIVVEEDHAVEVVDRLLRAARSH